MTPTVMTVDDGEQKAFYLFWRGQN